MLKGMMYAGIFFVICKGLVVGGESNVIFEKPLGMDRIAIVKNRIWQETQNNQQVRFQHGVMTVHDKEKGTEAIAWEKKGPIMDGWGRIQVELKVHDIVEEKERIAIAFTAGSTHVEVVQRSKEGNDDNYEIVFQESFFEPTSSGLGVITSAKLAWLDHLYFLVNAIGPAGTRIWRIDIDECSTKKVHQSGLVN